MKQRNKNISNPLSGSSAGGAVRIQEGINVWRKFATALAAVMAVIVVLFVMAATLKPDDYGDGELKAVEETSPVSGITGGLDAASAEGGGSAVVQESIRRERAPIRGSLKGGANTNSNKDDAAADYITLHTAHGNIRITLRPDLSSPSVQYVRDVINAGCDGCNLYRAEKPGILQGGFKSAQGVVKPNTIFGDCPKEYESIKQNCPKHDPNCGCHGPVMVKGMVGWAGGTPGGPDFFIETYEEPATFWGNQHTVWGFIRDEASLEVIKGFWELPSNNNGGMHLLKDAVPFTPSLP